MARIGRPKEKPILRYGVPGRECLKCHKWKPLFAFYAVKRGTFGRASYCIECYKKMRRDKYKQKILKNYE